MPVATENDVLSARAVELEALFRTHYSRVLKAAYRVTGSMSDAEDVLQSVFLRLARGENRLEGVANVESYLYRAAVNAALDLVRSRKDARSVSIDDPDADELPGVGPMFSPERNRASAELNVWFRQALAKLKPRQAEMFVLRYIEDYDNREIARLLNTSQAVVAVMLHRTRARLQKDFQSFTRGKR